MKVYVHKPGLRGALALVISAPEGIFRQFDGRGRKGDPQACGAFGVADCHRDPGHGRYPLLVVTIQSVPGEPDNAGVDRGLIPGL